MAWTVTGQVTGSPNITIGSTNHIWFSGVGGAFGTNVIVGSFQDGLHVSDANDAHLAGCTTGGHLSNVKYLSDTTASVNGSGSVALSAVVTTQAPLKFTFATTDLGGSAVATSGAKFFAYSSAEGIPVSGVDVKAAEAGTSSAWVDIGASGDAALGLTLANQSAATTHDFFVAVSASPTSTGAKSTNVFKLTLTYI